MSYLAEQVESLERRALAAEQKLQRVMVFGNQLANCAYNLKQSDRLTKHERDCLDAAQKGWDAARGGT